MELGISFVWPMFLIQLFCRIISAELDYYPPVIDETHKTPVSRDVKCLVCKVTLNEIIQSINKVDPKKTVDYGYGLDNKKKTVQLVKSETFLTELMENICDKLEDYAKARFKSNNTMTIMKLTTSDGGMNPDMGLVDFVQDGDLNKSLKHFCLEILEDNEEAALELLMKDKIPDDSERQLCSVAAKYCDDLPLEDEYILEEHMEL